MFPQMMPQQFAPQQIAGLANNAGGLDISSIMNMMIMLIVVVMMMKMMTKATGEM